MADETGGSTGLASEADTVIDDEEKLDLPIHVDLPGGEECASVSEAADLIPMPADIIFVVDNSGSMEFETLEIQAKINDFSAQIIDSGIDVHVILLSSYPGDYYGICVDPPLGSGGCPMTDNNPPVFTHVDSLIGSKNSWEKVLSTQDEWISAIRPDASKHIVVVSDDHSNMPLEEFDTRLKEIDPSFADYIHHSVVCHSICPSAYNIGERYIQLSQMTGGVASDLCDQDFQAVFDVLSTEVIAGSELACEFEIPAPPDDMEFNPDEVNLEFDDGLGAVSEIGRVDSAADCPEVVGGWYYDDPANPQRIIMCEQSCAEIQGVLNGSVSIVFGCATTPAG